jgi:hypothetical protein
MDRRKDTVVEAVLEQLIALFQRKWGAHVRSQMTRGIRGAVVFHQGNFLLFTTATITGPSRASGKGSECS